MRGITLVSSTRRGGIVLAVAAAFTLSTIGIAHAEIVPTDDPVDAAAGWLATQLTDDERVVNTDFDFDDAGLTADVVFALAGAGVASGSIESATDWLETQVGDYTGTAAADADVSGVYAGATAKLALVAAATARDPRAFGGTDLVAQLEAREQEDGRFTDDSSFGDFSNTITQSLAVLALERASDTAPSADAVALLAAQACDDGGFPQDIGADPCSSQVDATGFAVQALAAVGETAAVEAAVGWLVSAQGADGGYGNANSTGLAAIGLLLGGEDDAVAAARTYLLGLQAGCDDERAGAILFDAEDGGDPIRAGSQAVPGLVGSTLADVSAAGASSDIPVLDCPEPVEPEPVDPDPVDDEPVEEPAEPEPVPDTSGDTDGDEGDTDDEGGDDEGSDADDELADTGVDSGLLGLLAAVMLAAGALLLTTGRRSGQNR